MENPRPEKVAVVTEVRERLEASQAALVTEYRGLKVSELAALRRTLAGAGGEYKVYKNTLVRFAARDLGIEGADELLTGPTGITFVDGDAAAVAKALRDFSRANPLLVIRGGVLGDTVLDAGDVTALADLPSREVLLARLAGGLAAPMVQFAGLLQALPRGFAYGLKALIDAGGATPGAAAAAAPAADAAPTADVAPAADADTTETTDTPEAAPADGAVPETTSADTPSDTPAEEA